MLPLFESGALRPVIDSRYPLADIAAAHTYMASNANVGKVLIDL
jgi:NADPH:quinone reductase-like Zn-dependent oxidoreductase